MLVRLVRLGDRILGVGGRPSAGGAPGQARLGPHRGPGGRADNHLRGDAVNVASRMETHGVPGKIHVSEAVEAALRDRYRFEERGTIEVKGLGQMRTFFLTGKVGA